MELFAKARSGHWFPFTPPEGEPVLIADVIRSPIDNEPATHLQWGGTMPDSPPEVATEAGYTDTSQKPTATAETAVAEPEGSSESVTDGSEADTKPRKKSK